CSEGADKAKVGEDGGVTAIRKARVAVVPATYVQEVRSKFERELKEAWGIGDFSTIENPGYTSFLKDALVNSRKLDVLERETLEASIKELNFGESDYANSAKVVKMGQMLNADYVVIPEIRYISISIEEKKVPFVSEKQLIVKGKISTGVRTVDVATSRIVASNMSEVEKKTRFKDVKGSMEQQVRDFVNSLYAESGRQEAAAIIDTAYPIRIMALSDEKTCTINRGKGAVEEGEVMVIYKPGEVMIDPDTKENLGYDQVAVGKLKVTTVGEKTAKAEIMGWNGNIEKLFLCRRDKKAEKLTAEPIQPPAPKLD
ncbi:MAG: CsgG/HfaB family protein, partial [bacterium]